MTDAVQIALIVAVLAALPPTLAVVLSHRAQTRTLGHIAEVTTSQLSHVTEVTISKWDAAQERIADLQNELIELRKVQKI